MFGDTPPRWLRWANTSGARATTTIIAIFALTLSVMFGVRLQLYVNCVGDQQNADARRTAAIAAATDAERRADAALVAGPVPGGPSAAELRRLDVEARSYTDKVRAENPPPPERAC